MDPAKFSRIKQAFNAMAELPAAERTAWLDTQDDLDLHTRQHLYDLLHADADYAAATARSALPGTRWNSAAWLDRRVGAFRIVRELGHGGMGSVFLAERVDGVQQQVALKIVRPDLADAASLARFRLERQLLALLKHPNIPSMLDLGELPDGSPYAVMEYVDGQPIDRYVREHGLDLQACLRLFVEVCRTVAHAHRNLIVHRDLKPNNVLVDAEGHPQLLDFGIAKPLLGQVGCIDVEQTAEAAHFLSLSHAAPEQLNGNPITTACDVYSLGVLLYELLADAPPFVRTGLSPAQLVQQILHEDPPPPSLRGAGTDAPRRYRIRPDLDCIVLRCLRKEPEERYATLDALVADLEAFLAGRPVLARRGNAGYRLLRFVTRHRSAVLFAAALCVTGVTGAVLLWQQQRATSRQQLRAEEISGLILDTLAAIDAERNGMRDLRARDVFDRVAAQALADASLDTASRARLLTAIARMELGMGEPAQAEHWLVALPEAQLAPTQREAVRLLRAQTLIAQQRLDDARPLIVRGLQGSPHRAEWLLLDATHAWESGYAERALKRFAAGFATDTRGALPHSELLWIDAQRREALAELAQALRRLRSAGDGQDIVLTPTLEEMAYAAFAGHALDSVALLTLRRDRYIAQGDMTRALKVGRQSQAVLRGHYGEMHQRVAENEQMLARLRARSGEPASARQHYAEALGIARQVLPAHDTLLAAYRAEAAAHAAATDRCSEVEAPQSDAALAPLPPMLYDAAALLQNAAQQYCAYSRGPGADTAATALRALDQAAAGMRGDALQQPLRQLLTAAAARGVGKPPEPDERAGQPP